MSMCVGEREYDLQLEDYSVRHLGKHAEVSLDSLCLPLPVNLVAEKTIIAFPDEHVSVGLALRMGIMLHLKKLITASCQPSSIWRMRYHSP